MGKTRTFSDMLNDLYGGAASSGSTAGGLGQAQGVTTAGQAQSPHPYAQIFGSTLDPQQLQQLLDQFEMGLTAEEKEEMERLEFEYKQELKNQRLNAFKKVAPQMRQFVINALTWREDLAGINGVVVEKSARLQELQNKNKGGTNYWYTHSGGGGAGGSVAWSPIFDSSHMDGMLRMIGIPEGVTVDDLKQAHIEATLEEEMLNGEEESTT